MHPHILFLHPRGARCERLITLVDAASYRVSREDFSTTPEALLEQIIAARPDVLLLDFVILDEVRGWQLLHRLRIHRLTHALPVVVWADQAPLVTELRPHLERLGVSVVMSTGRGDEVLAEIQRRWHLSPVPPEAGACAHSG